MKYNKLIENFLKNNNYSRKILEDDKIYKKGEISLIVNQFGIYKNEISKNVSVADIIGNSIISSESKNIFEEMNEIFSKNGTKYQTRSISMLEYTSKNVLKGLNKSFVTEPIRLSEVLKGKYLVSSNGRHRYSILKAHYLNELSECKNDKEKNKLKLKYTIPIKVEELDVVKTYSQYLLHFLNKNLTVEEEIKNSLRTGKTYIEDENGNIVKYTDLELVQYVEKFIDKISKTELKNNIIKIYNKEEYFKDYIDNNFKETIFYKNVKDFLKF